MKVLVTGGLGFIGSHACLKLKSEGHQVITFDNLSRGNQFAAVFGHNFHGDIRQLHDLDSCFNNFGPFDAVIHFAALAYVGESVEDPKLYYENNVIGTRNLLKIMEKHSCQKLVFSSSCAVYGTPAIIPVKEESPRQPTSPYGLSKLLCELEIEYQTKQSKLSAICLRYFNVIGSDPDHLIGESHEPETHLVPNLINSAVNNKKFFMFGSDYKTPDGTNIRDYIDVNDLAEIHVLSIDKLNNTEGLKYKCINVGTGKPYSNLEMLKAVEEITNKKIEIEFLDRRMGDAVELYSDTELMKKEFSMKNKFFSLEESLLNAYKWELKK